MARWNKQNGKAEFFSANACLMPLYAVDRHLVLTVEGIGSRARLHPIQERLAMGHGTQCGFCSPGFVMAMYALLRNNPNPRPDQIKTAVCGNLCRCTGYRPILESLQTFSRDQGDSHGCCKGKSGADCPCTEGNQEDKTDASSEVKEICGLVNWERFSPYDPSMEIIFPPKLILMAKEDCGKTSTLFLQGRRVQLKAPPTLKEAGSILATDGTDRLISSGLITRLIQSMSPSQSMTRWLSLHRIPELSAIKVTADEIIVGSTLSISAVLQAIRKHSIGSNREQVLGQIDELFAKYSSDQVKNVASWTGALASASPTSDTCTLFLALSWKVIIIDAASYASRVLEASDFFGDSLSGLRPTEIVTNLRIPKQPNYIISTFKHGKRLGADDTVVNMVVCWNPEIKTARIAVGAFMQPMLLKSTAEELRRQSVATQLHHNLYNLLHSCSTPCI